MKLFKQLTSALLSMAIIASASAAGSAVQFSADAASSQSVEYSSVIRNWNQRIRTEKSKFPDRMYWNHKGKSSSQWGDECVSSTPCYHTPEKIKGTLYDSETSMTRSLLSNWADDSSQANKSDHCGECFGFARKLAKDIWGTEDFIRYYNFNKDYEPQIGDNVRLSFPVAGASDLSAEHSIFITDISDDHITFAECNGDMEHCQIFWDSFYYYSEFNYHWETYPDANGNNQSIRVITGAYKYKVTKDYLRQHTSFYERPHIKGDFNLNGKIDQNDVDHFRNTYYTKGLTYVVDQYGGKRNGFQEVYDINSDGQLTESDYTQIRNYANKSYPYGYLCGTGKTSINYTDRQEMRNDSILYNNGYYVKTSSNTASFIGPFFRNTTSFTVSSKIYDANGKAYTVTGIGDDNYCPGGMYIKNLKTITIPSSVTTIRKYAFSNSESALTSVVFSGTSGLRYIEDGAFYNSKKLKTIDMTKCPNLRTIGSAAFYNCVSLSYLDLSKCKSLSSVASDAFLNCSSIRVTYPSNFH